MVTWSSFPNSESMIALIVKTRDVSSISETNWPNSSLTESFSHTSTTSAIKSFEIIGGSFSATIEAWIVS